MQSVLAARDRHFIRPRPVPRSSSPGAIMNAAAAADAGAVAAQYTGTKGALARRAAAGQRRAWAAPRRWQPDTASRCPGAPTNPGLMGRASISTGCCPLNGQFHRWMLLRLAPALSSLPHNPPLHRLPAPACSQRQWKSRWSGPERRCRRALPALGGTGSARIHAGKPLQGHASICRCGRWAAHMHGGCAALLTLTCSFGTVWGIHVLASRPTPLARQQGNIVTFRENLEEAALRRAAERGGKPADGVSLVWLIIR